jgi:tetratricopeptide (TPR) repeat protein
MRVAVGRASGDLCQLGTGANWIFATGGLTVTDTKRDVDQPVAYPPKALKTTENARRDFVEGRLDAALHETKRALAINPRCAMAFHIQGVVNLSRADYDESGRNFQQAIDADPALGPAWVGLGMVFTSQGRFKEALAPLDRAASFLRAPGSYISKLRWLIWGSRNLVPLSLRFAYAERFIGSDHRQRKTNQPRKTGKPRLQEIGNGSASSGGHRGSSHPVFGKSPSTPRAGGTEPSDRSGQERARGRGLDRAGGRGAPRCRRAPVLAL